LIISVEDVIERVNSTPFGLQGPSLSMFSCINSPDVAVVFVMKIAGVFTDSIASAQTLFQRLDVGALAVNAGPGFRNETAPFGGVKLSGIGRYLSYSFSRFGYDHSLTIDVV
jgi:acyl-CoA reductase-like NAD-dependent aldehyde dehydrogenase